MIQENTLTERELAEARLQLSHQAKEYAEIKASMSKELNKRYTRIKILEKALAKFNGSARWVASDHALLSEGTEVQD